MTDRQLEKTREGTTLYYIDEDDQVRRGKLRKRDNDFNLGTIYWALTRASAYREYRMAEDIYRTFEEAKKDNLKAIERKLAEAKEQKKAV